MMTEEPSPEHPVSLPYLDIGDEVSEVGEVEAGVGACAINRDCSIHRAPCFVDRVEHGAERPLDGEGGGVPTDAPKDDKHEEEDDDPPDSGEQRQHCQPQPCATCNLAYGGGYGLEQKVRGRRSGSDPPVTGQGG